MPAHPISRGKLTALGDMFNIMFDLFNNESLLCVNPLYCPTVQEKIQTFA